MNYAVSNYIISKAQKEKTTVCECGLKGSNNPTNIQLR